MTKCRMIRLHFSPWVRITCELLNKLSYRQSLPISGEFGEISFYIFQGALRSLNGIGCPFNPKEAESKTESMEEKLARLEKVYIWINLQIL